jgi:IS30 family transposase
MKAGHDQIQIANLLDRHKSNISREISLIRGLKGYRPKQACATATKRAEKSRNAATLPPRMAEQAACLLKLQWSPEQIAGKLPVSHETLYQHVYLDKARGGTLWKNLRCQNQKRKRYTGGRDKSSQIPHRRPLSDQPSHVEAGK